MPTAIDNARSLGTLYKGLTSLFRSTGVSSSVITAKRPFQPRPYSLTVALTQPCPDPDRNVSNSRCCSSTAHRANCLRNPQLDSFVVGVAAGVAAQEDDFAAGDVEFVPLSPLELDCEPSGLL